MSSTETKNGIFFYITKTLLIISIALSLFLSGILCYRVIVDPNFKIELNHIYLIGILFVTGILGDQLSDILNKVISTKLDKYLQSDDWKQFVRDNIEPIIANNKIIQGIKENIKITNLEDSAMDENSVVESQSVIKDAVIVPASWSMIGNKNFKIYFCQKDRSFGDAKYIALYADKMIQCIGQRRKLSQIELDKKLQDSTVKKWLLEEMDIIPDVNLTDFYDISNDYRLLQIAHNKSGPLVRKQIYSSFETLKKAKSTEDI